MVDHSDNRELQFIEEVGQLKRQDNFHLNQKLSNYVNIVGLPSFNKPDTKPDLDELNITPSVSNDDNYFYS